MKNYFLSVAIYLCLFNYTAEICPSNIEAFFPLSLMGGLKQFHEIFERKQHKFQFYNGFFFWGGGGHSSADYTYAKNLEELGWG